MTRQERIKLMQRTFDDADKLAEEALDLFESVNPGDVKKGEAKLKEVVSLKMEGIKLQKELGI